MLLFNFRLLLPTLEQHFFFLSFSCPQLPTKLSFPNMDALKLDKKTTGSLAKLLLITFTRLATAVSCPLFPWWLMIMEKKIIFDLFSAKTAPSGHAESWKVTQMCDIRRDLIITFRRYYRGKAYHAGKFSCAYWVKMHSELRRMPSFQWGLCRSPSW